MSRIIPSKKSSLKQALHYVYVLLKLGEPFLNRLLFVIFQVDAELNKELEQWNEMLRNDAVKLCQENNFNTGFFEGSDNNCVVDAYELKVMILFKT